MQVSGTLNWQPDSRLLQILGYPTGQFLQGADRCPQIMRDSVHDFVEFCFNILKGMLGTFRMKILSVHIHCELLAGFSFGRTRGHGYRPYRSRLKIGEGALKQGQTLSRLKRSDASNSATKTYFPLKGFLLHL
ncbi:hypothetical protein P775_21675 [Puniceibacterium antarcticum]|uniref:Uncharacterized protein n=1 Tax=Puniceibacterium antarcticum TaxID=1206336 RepID=A0A2G8R916_9RHOB|nr:hypothetical protein P775_21675 [Puniceibacterium antarcticum]